jgi:hypothetical protein
MTKEATRVDQNVESKIDVWDERHLRPNVHLEGFTIAVEGHEDSAQSLHPERCQR